MDENIVANSQLSRCEWCGEDPVYMAYHDNEWGVAVYDDSKLFEMLILEGAQAGLSWITVLKRREGYREVFDGFDVEACASYTDQMLLEKLTDARIIRNRLKVFSVRKNALAFKAVQASFGSFSHYLWSFVNHTQIVNHNTQLSDLVATSPLSDAVSKDLKKRGFTFVGSTIIYAYLQAVGVIDDHVNTCFKRG